MDADAANPRPTNGVDDSVKRWPASYALITAWLLPATTTARMAHVTLWRAFLVHLASGVLALVAICLISSWDESRRTVPPTPFVDQCADAIADMPKDIERYPRSSC